jgi:hypothetical protein
MTVASLTNAPGTSETREGVFDVDRDELTHWS